MVSMIGVVKSEKIWPRSSQTIEVGVRMILNFFKYTSHYQNNEACSFAKNLIHIKGVSYFRNF
jgi:hypothetical protein